MNIRVIRSRGRYHVLRLSKALGTTIYQIVDSFEDYLSAAMVSQALVHGEV